MINSLQLDLETEALERMDRDLGGSGDGKVLAELVGRPHLTTLGLVTFLAEKPTEVDRIIESVERSRACRASSEARASKFVGCVLALIALLAWMAGAGMLASSLVLSVVWCFALPRRTRVGFRSPTPGRMR